MKQGLRLPDRNARIYRKPQSKLLDAALAIAVLTFWSGTFLAALVGGGKLGLPGWAVLIFAGFCTLMIASLSLLLQPVRRGASVLLSTPHWFSIPPPSS